MEGAAHTRLNDRAGFPAGRPRRRRRRRSRAHRAAGLVASALLGATLAGCGTRLPHSAFVTEPPPLGTAAATGGATTTSPQQAASDVGVTATTITLGLVVSKTSPLGAETFSGPMYGAQAFVQNANANGGIAGRQVKLVVCDDGATGAGNTACVKKLIDDDKVFAFVGNSIYDYAGAAFVDQRGVPDVGGQPITNAYDQYHHLWSIYGTPSPRNGVVGWNGTLSGGTEVYHYFKETLGAKTAGVVAYNQSDSLRFADLTEKGLRAEGYDVVTEQLDFAVPSWDAAAIDMKAKGVDVVFDALDSAGNVNLCKAMDAAGLHVKAKAVTVQSWDESVRDQYRQSPTCRNSLYATGNTRNYMDTSDPTIARFRHDIKAAFPDRENRLSMWEVEGWASAQWLSDALQTCPAAPTRACVEAYLSRPEPYDGHGILTPRDFTVIPAPRAIDHNCLDAAKWSDDAYGGGGGWLTTTPDGKPVCYDVPDVFYTP